METNQAKKYLQILLTQNLNNICFDCSKQSPSWVNLKYGVIICTDCAVNHRKESFRLKSIVLDIFTEEDIKRIALSGNFISKNWSSFRDKYNYLEYRIEEIEKKLENESKSLQEIFDKKTDFEKKEIKQERKPFFGKKVDRLVKEVVKSEKIDIVPAVQQNTSTKVTIKEDVSLINKSILETDGVDRNRIGFGILRSQKKENE